MGSKRNQRFREEESGCGKLGTLGIKGHVFGYGVM